MKEGKSDTIPWADGRVFYGRQALDAGLVDGVSTLAGLIDTYGDPTIATKEKIAKKVRAIRQGGNHGIDA